MDAIILPAKIKESYESYNECAYHMKEQGCKDLGWANSGIYIPSSPNWKEAYTNRSGSSVLMVEPIHRVYYSVDMGD